MLETYLIRHGIVNAIVWLVLYTCDYYLTLLGSKLSRQQSIMCYEGSYEMEPEYQDDIDKSRKISPHFIAWLLIGTAALLLPIPDVEFTQKLYALLIGVLLVPEVAANLKHAEGIWFWRKLGSKTPGATGSVCMGMALSYHRAAVNGLCLGLVVLIAAALGSSLILLGGGVMMLVQALTQYQNARTISRMQAMMAEQPEEA